MRSGLNRGPEDPGPVSHHRVSCLVGKDYTVLLQTPNPSSSEQEHVGGPDLSWQSQLLQENEDLSTAGSQYVQEGEYNLLFCFYRQDFPLDSRTENNFFTVCKDLPTQLLD